MRDVKNEQAESMRRLGRTACHVGHSGRRARRGVVLVVDDDCSVRILVARLLRMEGYEVLEAGLPSTALELVSDAERDINLLVSDMLMPQMRGDALARRCREFRPTLPVIFMSGFFGGFDPRKAELLGAPMLDKPVSVRELSGLVAATLRPPSSKWNELRPPSWER